ncbi:MAG: DUF503 domain-containing protein [Phototrophicaceae bacterium]|jgi:uncharacterized protein YlxP (DUF503 family)
MTAIVGLCTLEFHLPEAQSLKDKRATLKSVLSKLQNTFHVSAAETDFLDKWQRAEIAFVIVSNSQQHNETILEEALRWIETHYPQILIMSHHIDAL